MQMLTRLRGLKWHFQDQSEEQRVTSQVSHSAAMIKERRNVTIGWSFFLPLRSCLQTKLQVFCKLLAEIVGFYRFVTPVCYCDGLTWTVIAKDPVLHAGLLKGWPCTKAASASCNSILKRHNRFSVMTWAALSPCSLELAFLMLNYFVFHFSDLKHSGHGCLESDEHKLPKCTVLFPAPSSVTSWFRCPGRKILCSRLHQPSWVQLLSPVLRLHPARCFLLFRLDWRTELGRCFTSLWLMCVTQLSECDTKVPASLCLAQTLLCLI